MKVILLDNVKGVGQVGDIKEVSDGYARNFLLPRGLGKRITDGVMKEVAGLKIKKLQVQALEHAQSVELAAKLAGATIALQGKANEKGTLFSSISEADIAEQLSKQAGAHIPATAVVIEGHIKSVGMHNARVQLASDVSADVTVEVQSLP
ncbi:MAG: 50S ribosomal protein L9 [Patescibacteria group bacterium]